jgi:hypothetical protein
MSTSPLAISEVSLILILFGIFLAIPLLAYLIYVCVKEPYKLPS